MDIVVMVLDLMCAPNINCQLMNQVKMWFLVRAIVHQGILIIEKKILVLGEGQTDALGGTTVMVEAEDSVNIATSRKEVRLSLHFKFFVCL